MRLCGEKDQTTGLRGGALRRIQVQTRRSMHDLGWGVGLYAKYENWGGRGGQFQNYGKQGAGGGATYVVAGSTEWQSESQRAVRGTIQRTQREGESDQGEERGRRGGELVRRTLSKMADSHSASNGTAAPGGMSDGGDGLLEPMKYIVVTGGVVSGLGKGVTISSIGRMLKNCGLRTTSIKIDPYLVGARTNFPPMMNFKKLKFI